MNTLDAINLIQENLDLKAELNEKDDLINNLYDSLSDKDSTIEDANNGCEIATIRIDKLTDTVGRLVSLIEHEMQGFNYPYEHKIAIIEHAKNVIV
jgi:hypothetical protein